MEDDSDRSAPNEADDSLSFVDQELEFLKSIYINEIDVEQDDLKYTVSIDLYPATADNHDQQYVRMTLKFILSDEYPHAVPEIAIRNPRGLSEEKLFRISQHLFSIAENKVGSSMLFEIIEAAKEHLTADNRPCGECAICLYGFSDEDVFTKTECYHYFHSHCLARYSRNITLEDEIEKESGDDGSATNKELVCPMCRLPIHFEGSEELYPPPSAADDEFVFNEEMLEVQKRMADLYQKQVVKGGIIDIEAEKNKYLLEISNVPTRGSNVAPEESETDGGVTTPNTTENAVSSRTLEMDKDGKDTTSSSKISRNNSSKPEEKSKSERYKKFNRQPRNNYQESPYRKYNYSKYNAQKSNSKDKPVHEEDEVSDSHEHEISSNSKSNSGDLQQDSTSEASPRPKTSFPSYRRNDRRTNNYGASKRYGNEENTRDNYYRHSDSNYDNRDRRYRYERQNSRGQGYRGGHRRPYPRRGTDECPSESVNVKSTASTPDLEEGGEPFADQQPLSKEAECEKDEPVERRYNEGRGDSGNAYRQRRPYLKKKQYSSEVDSGRRSGDANASRVQKDANVSHENESDLSQTSPSRDEPRKFSNRHDSFRGQSGRRPYRGQDGFRRNSYGHNRQNYRRNSPGERYRTQDHNQRHEENGDKYVTASREESGKYPSSRYQDRRQHDREDQAYFRERGKNHYQRNKFDRRNNPRRNSYEEDNLDERNFNDDQEEHVGRSVNPRDEEDGNNPLRRDNFPRNNRFKRNSNRGFSANPQHQGNRMDDYPQRGGYRNPNRGNSYFQNRNSNYRNQQNNGKYQSREKEGNYDDHEKNGVFRNGEKCTQSVDAGAENAGEPLGDFGKNSIAKDNQKNSDSQEAVVLKHTNSHNPPEPQCKEPPSVDVKVPALASFKVLPPPPGFSNPLKKVVYGLQAANPPPGFPRS